METSNYILSTSQGVGSPIAFIMPTALLVFPLRGNSSSSLWDQGSALQYTPKHKSWCIVQIWSLECLWNIYDSITVVMNAALNFPSRNFY